MRAGVALLWFFAVLMPATASAGEKSPRELYDALNALRIDPAATYTIEGPNRIELRRADVQLSFEEGKLGFFAALDGRISGAVFAAHDPLLSRLIAVKTLHVEIEDAERESFNALFLN